MQVVDGDCWDESGFGVYLSFVVLGFGFWYYLNRGRGFDFFIG